MSFFPWMRLPSRWLAFAEMHFIVFVWGFTAILGKLIEAHALDLVWNRMAIATLVIGLWCYSRKVSLTLPWSTLWPLLGTGLIIALHWVTFYHAIDISNIALTLAGLATSALWASLIKSFYRRQIPGINEIILAGIAMFAMLLLMNVQHFSAWAWWTACLSAMLAAWFAVLNSKFTGRFQPLQVAFWEMLGGLLGITLWLLIDYSWKTTQSADFTTNTAIPWPWLNVSAMDWFWISILALVCTCYPFVASIRLMRHIDPFTFVLSVNMEPVYGIVLGWLIFRETELMSPVFYGGTAILIGTVLADTWYQNYRDRRERLRKNASSTLE
jgi:drug/metabolite transporter (DMT)-like permease